MTDEVQTYHLRALFSNYEKSFLTEHLVIYLRRIQRHLPQSEISQTQTFLNSNHSLIQFESSAESFVNAYEIFNLQVNLCHSFSPSELFFTAKLLNIEQFPHPYALTNSQQTADPNHATMLSLNTPTGTLPVISHYPKHQQKTIVIYSLTLNLHLEQLQYSMAPYNKWHQVETAGGHLYFPSEPGILHSFPPLQNETIRTFPHLPRNVGFHQPNYQDDFPQQNIRPHRPFANRNTFSDRAPQFHQQPNPLSEFQNFSPIHGPPPNTTHIQTGVAYTDPVFPPVPNNELTSATYQPPSNAEVGTSHQQILGATSLSPEKAILSQQYLSDQLNNIMDIQQRQRAKEIGTRPRRPPLPSSHLPSNTNLTRPSVPQPRMDSPQQFGPPGPNNPTQHHAPRPLYFRGQTTPHQHRPPQPRRQNLHQTSLVTNSPNQPPNLSQYNLQPVPLADQPSAPAQNDQQPPTPKQPPAPQQHQQHAGAHSVPSDPELIISPHSGNSHHSGYYHLSDNFMDWDFEQEEEALSLNLETVVLDRPDQNVVKDSLNIIDNIQNGASSLPSLVVPDDPVDMILDKAGLNKRKPKSKAVDKIVYEGKGKKPTNDDVTVESHSSSKSKLDSLSDTLKNFPRTNPFSSFATLDPNNPDQMLYNLPPYMEPYIQSLLSRINDHLPPSNLATNLQPFILLDTASEKYVSIDRNLNLIILQKLDFFNPTC